MRWSLLVVALALSGCSQGDPVTPPDAVEGPAGDAVPESTSSPSGVPPDPDPAGQALPALPTTNLTAFHWVQAEAIAMLAVELAFDLGPEERPCELVRAGSSQPPDYGPWLLTLVEGDGWGSRTLSVPDTGGSVHGGGVDTRDELAEPGHHAIRGRTTWSSCSGPVTVTLVGRGIVPHDFTNGTAAYLSLTSEAPFRFLGARGGPEAWLASQGSFEGGTGVQHAQAGSIGVGDGATFPMQALAVRAVGETFGGQSVSEIRVTHPGGETTWSHQGATRDSLEGPAGEYAFAVDHVAQGGVYVGAWSVDALDLGAARVAAAAGKGP